MISPLFFSLNLFFVFFSSSFLLLLSLSLSLSRLVPLLQLLRQPLPPVPLLEPTEGPLAEPGELARALAQGRELLLRVQGAELRVEAGERLGDLVEGLGLPLERLIFKRRRRRKRGVREGT